MDVVCFEETKQMGIGMVIRDDSGSFMLAHTLVFSDRLDVDVGEIMGFHEALSWAQRLGLEQVCIEGDSKVAVDALISNTKLLSVSGDYVRACTSILAHNNSFRPCLFRALRGFEIM